MNKKGHVLNALLLAIGIGYVLEPAGDAGTFLAIGKISVPIVLGALFPDVDTAFGRHRKTLHNLPVLAVFVAWPVVFGNLHYVWIGVLTHFVLDLVGTKRGLALLYPLDREFEFPFGVATSSRLSTAVTLLVTAVELALFAAVHVYVVSLDTEALGTVAPAAL